MTLAFTAAELAALVVAQEAHMMDACEVGTRSDDTQDEAGQTIPDYDYGDEIICGFQPTGGRVGRTADGMPIFSDVAFRLPLGTSVQACDRIKITQRFGEDTTEVEYDVAAEPREGPSGLVVPCNKVVS